MQVGAVRHVATGFHFHVDKAQRAVVEHHHLDRQVQLADAQQISQQHRQATIATQRHHLTLRVLGLGPQSLWQSVGHRAVVERAEQTALAVHVQVACGPQRWRADIDGKDCICVGLFIDQTGEVLRVNRRTVWRRRGQFVQLFTGLGVVLQGLVEETAIGMRLEPWLKRFKGFPHASNQTQRHGRAAAQLRRVEVDLDDVGFFRVEIPIGEAAAENHQRVAGQHGVIAGAEADQAGHADVERVVVFNVLLATQGMNNGGAQRIGQCKNLLVSTCTACTAQQGHGFRVVEHVGHRLQVVVCRDDSWRRGLNPFRSYIRGFAERYIAGQDDNGNTFLADRRAHGTFQHTGELLGVADQFDEVAALLEQLLRVGFLKVIQADFRGRNVRSNRQHRHAVAMAVVQAIDQVQVARSAAACTDRQLAAGCRLGTGGEGCDFFMTGVHPANRIGAFQAVGQAVEAVTGHPPDVGNTCRCEGLRKMVGDGLGH
ncbi:hypothetical protein ALQ89_06473 [Pseudomonas amygdali pv. tabaci]|uniref:Uncharacterized protein n=1 Tax=Pseudomonas amygdali pv. tabaci TaxID=322 RepID=A0AAX1W2J8_PSEAJ|nr:hypothetical protein ALQ89_06473 [Pseudomonas amygdali pv. tabaci]